MKKVYFILSVMLILLMAGCSNKQGTTIKEEKITTETSGSEVEKDEKVTTEKTTEENITEEKTTDLESTETSIAVDGNNHLSDDNHFETYEEAYEAVIKQNYSDEDVSLQLDLGFEYPVLCVGQRDYYCEFWYYNKETKMCMKATERLEEGTWGRMTEYIPGQNYLIQQGHGEDDEGNPSTWQEVYELCINDESGQLELNYIDKIFDNDTEIKSIWDSTN